MTASMTPPRDLTTKPRHIGNALPNGCHMSDWKASFGKALTALETLEVDTTELDTLKRGILANGFADFFYGVARQIRRRAASRQLTGRTA
jgi:hypothetical protein